MYKSKATLQSRKVDDFPENQTHVLMRCSRNTLSVCSLCATSPRNAASCHFTNKHIYHKLLIKAKQTVVYAVKNMYNNKPEPA